MTDAKITTCLWFDGQAEEATRFNVSVFKNSKIGSIMPGPDGKAIAVTFTLDGVSYTALNGGPQFKFNEAISLIVHCETQQEVDDYWAKLTADGGEESMCAWLKDKYGLSWQIVPSALPRLLSDPVRDKAQRVMQAMLKMRKIDIAALERA